MQDGLVGHWAFNETSGTVATDSSGSGNNGTLINGPARMLGIIGQALLFDGSNDYVEVPHASSLNTSSAMTVSVWINNQTLTGADEQRVIASKGWAAGSGGSWTLTWSAKSGLLYFYVGRATSYRYVSLPYGNAQVGSWHHITAVVNNGQVSLYQDGVLKAGPNGLDSSTMRTSQDPIRIASSGSSSSTVRNWDGLIDEFRVYNRALNVTEIVSLYQGQTGATTTTTPSFNFALANSGSLTVTPGSSVSNTITATLVSGSPQPVSFSVSGLPQGASASFSQSTCSPNCSSQLTVSTSSSTPTGSYSLTVKGTAGSVSSSTIVGLTVNTNPFSFSLTNSGSLTVTQGSSATNTITATRISGTTQPISFSVTGLPQGASASFSQSTCTPNCSSQLTVSTSSSSPVGNYSLVVKGTAGSLSNTTTVAVRVDALSGTSTTTSSTANCSHYASPTGTGNGLSLSNPFKISKFWSVASPGKTLCLLDGTYTGSESMIDPPDKLSGTASSRITIRALNDGKVTINGQGARRPVFLKTNNYLVLEGFNAHGSSDAVIQIYLSNYIEIRRVAAWDAYDGNNSIVSAGSSQYLLFEDVAAWGIGRKVFSTAQGGNHATCRRCWGRWEGSHFLGPKLTYSLAYNNYYMIIENSIGTWSGEKMQQVYSLKCAPGETNSKCGRTMTGYTVDQAEGIFGVDRMDGDKNARSKLLGSIAYISIKDRFQPGKLYWVTSMDSVEYNSNAAYIQPGSNATKVPFALYNNPGGTSNLVAKNLTAVRTTPSVIHNQWQKSNISEGTSISSVGNLYSSSQGAQICKRYKDGVLTSEPLWPWPMNQRIKDAMVLSGRAAVDVTQTVESMFGTIPSQCRK